VYGTYCAVIFVIEQLSCCIIHEQVPPAHACGHLVFDVGSPSSESESPSLYRLHSSGTPGDAKCVTAILGRGIRMLGGRVKFGELILRKIIKIVATRCHI